MGVSAGDFPDRLPCGAVGAVTLRVDAEQRGNLPRYLDEFIEIPLPDIATTDTVAGNSRLFAEQAGGELLKIKGKNKSMFKFMNT